MLQMYLESFKCDQETDEWGADEPYFIVASAVLPRAPIGTPTPMGPVQARLFGPVRANTHDLRPGPGIKRSVWNVNGQPERFEDPDRALVVVAVMENDGGAPDVVRAAVQLAVQQSLFESALETRPIRVERVIRAMATVLSAPSAPGEILNADERLGEAQELWFSPDELAQANAGATVQKSMIFSGDGGQYTLNFELRQPTRIGNAPDDRWVVTLGRRVLAIKSDGGVFAHDEIRDTLYPAYQLTGPPVAAQAHDRFVLTIQNRIFVILEDGKVFAHDVDGNTIGPAYRLNGPQVAFRAVLGIDRWVLGMGALADDIQDRFLVITSSGEVWAHDVQGRDISPAFRMVGPAIGTEPWSDLFPIALPGSLCMVKEDGMVVNYPLVGERRDTLGAAHLRQGARIVADDHDRQIVTMPPWWGERSFRTTIVVLRDDGQVFGHELLTNGTIGQRYGMA